MSPTIESSVSWTPPPSLILNIFQPTLSPAFLIRIALSVWDVFTQCLRIVNLWVSCQHAQSLRALNLHVEKSFV